MSTVKCTLCGRLISDPVDHSVFDNRLNEAALHFTKKHVKQLKEFLAPITLGDILMLPYELSPSSVQMNPDGRIDSINIDIKDAVMNFVLLNSHSFLTSVSA